MGMRDEEYGELTESMQRFCKNVFAGFEQINGELQQTQHELKQIRDELQQTRCQLKDETQTLTTRVNYIEYHLLIHSLLCNLTEFCRDASGERRRLFNSLNKGAFRSISQVRDIIAHRTVAESVHRLETERKFWIPLYSRAVQRAVNRMLKICRDPAFHGFLQPSG